MAWIRGFFVKLGFLAGFFLIAGFSHGAAPANDTCAGAEVIPGGAVFPYFTAITPDVTEATEVGDPALTSACTDGEAPEVSRGIWYQFTPQESGSYTFSVGNDTATTLDDTVMGVFSSANGCEGPWIQIACNDDSGLNKSALKIDLQAGVDYYVLVWVYGSSAFPPEPPMTGVQLKVAKPAVPVNDTCAGAEVIPGEAEFPYFTDVVDTVDATQTSDPPRPSCQIFNYRSVWYEFTPGRTSLYSISTGEGARPTTATTIYDTMLAVYRSDNGCAGPLTAVACNDDASTLDVRSVINVVLETGVTYYIVAWDRQLDPTISETEMQLRITVPPEAETLPATDITSARALLHGFVKGNGATFTRFFFEYGATTNYGLKTDAPFLLSSTPQAFTNLPVMGLSPDTIYHYRFVATNNNGMAFGADRTLVYSTAQPNISQFVGPVQGQTVQLQFNGAEGQVYRVEASTNLSFWEDIGPAQPLGGGLFQFIELGSSNYPARFYKLRSP